MKREQVKGEKGTRMETAMRISRGKLERAGRIEKGITRAAVIKQKSEPGTGVRWRIVSKSPT